MKRSMHSKKITAFKLLLLTALSSLAQTSGQVEMADAMHESGKIYVVVAVLSVVFIGIVIFLVTIERKVSRLEKKMEERKN